MPFVRDKNLVNVYEELDKANGTVKNLSTALKDEEENKFLTGMFAEANIVISTKIAQALPSEAVVDIDGTSYVLRFVSKKDNLYLFEKVPIVIGTVHDGFIEIYNIEALDLKDRFLTKGAFDFL